MLKSVWRTQRTGARPVTRKKTPSGPFSLVTVKPWSVDGPRSQDDPLGHGLADLLASGVDVAGHREAQLAQALVRHGRDDEDLDAPRLEVGLDHLGQLARLGTSALLSTTMRVRSESGRPPRSASGT